MHIKLPLPVKSFQTTEYRVKKVADSQNHKTTMMQATIRTLRD